MKKIVLTFGLISGFIVCAVMLLVTLPFHEQLMRSGAAYFVGYASMVAASTLVYFGVRRYRDTVAGGRVSFGRAFGVGMLIVLVSGLCYTAAWEIVYFGGFAGNFIESYQAQSLAEERAKGATEAELASKRAEMEQFARLYENPAINAAMTFAEPLPVGLLAALISAAMLRRRRTADGVERLAGTPAT